MRITPSHPRLRIIAISCWVIGGWCLLQAGQIARIGPNTLLSIPVIIVAVLFLALGVAYWMLGTDRQAGVVFDPKGLMFNLGHSAAFVSWDNIATVGVSYRRNNLLSLGSFESVGIRLQRPAEYLQSYEQRLPASNSLLAWATRQIQNLLRRVQVKERRPTLTDLEALREHTGYDLLISATQLGGSAHAFVDLVETYRSSPRERRSLQIGVQAQSVL